MLKPLGDRVVLKVEEEKEQTVGGLVLAGVSKERTQVATVVSVGEGSRTLTGELVAPSVAAEVKDGDDKVMIVREAEILAVLA